MRQKFGDVVRNARLRKSSDNKGIAIGRINRSSSLNGDESIGTVRVKNAIVAGPLENQYPFNIRSPTSTAFLMPRKRLEDFWTVKVLLKNKSKLSTGPAHQQSLEDGAENQNNEQSMIASTTILNEKVATTFMIEVVRKGYCDAVYTVSRSLYDVAELYASLADTLVEVDSILDFVEASQARLHNSEQSFASNYEQSAWSCLRVAGAYLDGIIRANEKDESRIPPSYQGKVALAFILQERFS
jgi:hypothetical protein